MKATDGRENEVGIGALTFYSEAVQMLDVL